MKSCKKCGVFLDLDKVEKALFILKYKERFNGDKEEYKYFSINGFYCPVCKQIHVKRDYYEYELHYAKEDENIDSSLSDDEFIRNKLNIKDIYTDLNYYGEKCEY